MNEIIDKLQAAVNSHDVDAMVALFHADYRSTQPAHPGQNFVGRSQVRANWTAVLAGVPDFRSEVIRSAVHGDTVWCELSWSGHRIDGHPFAMAGVAIFEIREELIVAGTLCLEEVESSRGIEQAVEDLSGRRPEPTRPTDDRV